MIFVFTISFILIVIIILIILGKPVNIAYKVDKFLDSFEKTDYNKEGRIKQDYLAWNFSEYTIKVNYGISYKWTKNPFRDIK